MLIGAAYVYGNWRLQQPPARPGPLVALLQGNLDQRIRDAAFPVPADKQEAARVLEEIRNAGSYQRERVIMTPQGTTIRVSDGKPVLTLCANNYLGLAQHPSVATAAKAAISPTATIAIRIRGPIRDITHASAEIPAAVDPAARLSPRSALWRPGRASNLKTTGTPSRCPS